MSTRCSPKIATLEEAVEDEEEDEGRSLRTDRTNWTNAVGESVCFGDQVSRMEHKSVWYAVVRTSMQLGLSGLQWGEIRIFRL
jgi:hypothetical protein